MNNYKKSIEIINNSDFTIKGLKTFTGREGYGINANLYHKGKKVAFLLDSGNGGCLDVDWENGYTWKDNPIIPLIKSDEFGLGDYTWDEETICNNLIDEYLKVKDFKKVMKKVVVLSTKNQILEYSAKASDLDKVFKFKEGRMTFRDRVNLDNTKAILNDLPTNEAYDIYVQNR